MYIYITTVYMYTTYTVIIIIVFLFHYNTIFMYVICRLCMTSCHTGCKHRPNLWLPDDGQDIWPKHVGAVYNKSKNSVQLVGGEIYVH
jgi:hypothetical protein